MAVILTLDHLIKPKRHLHGDGSGVIFLAARRSPPFNRGLSRAVRIPVSQAFSARTGRSKGQNEAIKSCDRHATPGP
jgi:hypothetical protein